MCFFSPGVTAFGTTDFSGAKSLREAADDAAEEDHRRVRGELWRAAVAGAHQDFRVPVRRRSPQPLLRRHCSSLRSQVRYLIMKLVLLRPLKNLNDFLIIGRNMWWPFSSCMPVIELSQWPAELLPTDYRCKILYIFPVFHVREHKLPNKGW